MHPAKEVKKEKKSEPGEKHEGYFEAVIQLRNVEQKLIDFVFIAADDENLKVSKVKWLKHGVDLFVSNRKFAQHMSKTLQQKFGGMVKLSSRLFTRDRYSGKEVHRVTMLFKQFPYGKGEQFAFKGETYTVLGVTKEVYVEDAQHVKKKLKFDELELGRVF